MGFPDCRLCVCWLLLTINLPKVTIARVWIPFDFGWKHRTGLTDWARPNDVPPNATDPGLSPPEARVNYDDSDWWDIQLPHDGLIVNAPSRSACPDGCSGRSYIPRHLLWYRKRFSLPSAWLQDNSSFVALEFDGSFRQTTLWFDGEIIHKNSWGYLPFQINLPMDSIRSSARKDHVLAVFVDPDNGFEGATTHASGWWYEGGGLYRHVRLSQAHKVHVANHGLFVHSIVNGASATLTVEASVINEAVNSFVYQIELFDPITGRNAIKSCTKALPSAKGTAPVLIEESFDISNAKLWTTSEPHLYQVKFSILSQMNLEKRTVIDEITTKHGIRSIRFDANEGFFLNEKYFKIRGFCDHDAFAVVGMAVPERVSLFRAQASRSIGGNGRRTSHNPPDPSVLEIYDRLGMVVIDETRLFGNDTAYIKSMGRLVRRDRNHPCVIIWSFCNEFGCSGERQLGGPAFQAIVERLDGSRPTLANMMTFNVGNLSHIVDIQGLSHPERERLEQCHVALPTKPVFSSECCSCNTMRDEDVGCETRKDNPHYSCNQKAFNARCLDLLVNASDGVDYVAGTMVWTLFDYYGEPPSAGLTVSSTYGQFDLCGFPKSSAFWFRSQWLLGTGDSRPDKPFPTHSSTEVHIVESWESPDTWDETKGNTSRAIHVYTNAPFVELFLNDVSYGVQGVTPMVQGDGGSFAEWQRVPWEPGILTAIALTSNGSLAADTSKSTNSDPTSIMLSLDSPSPATGTGLSLFLDGQDVALVRATVVDSLGHVSHMATNNVTFCVISGPGVLLGSSNGDPKSYEPHTSPSQRAYHGLVRGIVRVTSAAGLNEGTKGLISIVDRHPAPTFSLVDNDDIVIEATSPGLRSARLRIPTSTDPESSVLAVAEAFAGQAVNFFSSQSNAEDFAQRQTTTRQGL